MDMIKSRSSTILLSVVFGTAAGFVGTLLAIAYLMPWITAPNISLLVGRGRTPIPSEITAQNYSALVAAGRAGVRFAPAKKTALTTSDIFSAGAVFTADGWVMTTSDVSGGGFIALIEGASYPVGACLRDAFTSFFFCKISATNLPVASFGSAETTAPLSPVIGFDAFGGPRKLTVIDRNERPDSTDAIRSSERVQKFLRLEKTDALLPGAAIMTTRGEVIGLFVKNTVGGAYAIPIDSIPSQISAIVRQQKTVRPLLGVHYIDLATGPVATRNGVLLADGADGKSPAVIKGSPAELAGMQRGDMVTAVNGEDLTIKKGFADLLAEYAPGSELTLAVSRQGANLAIKVTLK